MSLHAVRSRRGGGAAESGRRGPTCGAIRSPQAPRRWSATRTNSRLGGRKRSARFATGGRRSPVRPGEARPVVRPDGGSGQRRTARPSDAACAETLPVPPGRKRSARLATGGRRSPVRPGETRPVVRADGGSGQRRTAYPGGRACAETLRVPPGRKRSARLATGGRRSPVRPGEARPVVRPDGGSGRRRTAYPGGRACAETLRVPPGRKRSARLATGGRRSPVRPGETRPVVRPDGGSGRRRTAYPGGRACAETLRVPPVTGVAGLSGARTALPLRAVRARLTRAWSSPGRGR